jgi:hypothetical protein
MAGSFLLLSVTEISIYQLLSVSKGKMRTEILLPDFQPLRAAGG